MVRRQPVTLRRLAAMRVGAVLRRPPCSWRRPARWPRGATGARGRRQGGHRPLQAGRPGRRRRPRPARHLVLGRPRRDALGRPASRPTTPARTQIPAIPSPITNWASRSAHLRPAGGLSVPVQAAPGRARRGGRVRHCGQPAGRPRSGPEAQRPAHPPQPLPGVPGAPRFPAPGRRSTSRWTIRRSSTPRSGTWPRPPLDLCRLAASWRAHIGYNYLSFGGRGAPLPACARPVCRLPAGDRPVQQHEPHPAGVRSRILAPPRPHPGLPADTRNL